VKEKFRFIQFSIYPKNNPYGTEIKEEEKLFFLPIYVIPLNPRFPFSISYSIHAYDTFYSMPSCWLLHFPIFLSLLNMDLFILSFSFHFIFLGTGYGKNRFEVVYIHVHPTNRDLQWVYKIISWTSYDYCVFTLWSFWFFGRGYSSVTRRRRPGQWFLVSELQSNELESFLMILKCTRVVRSSKFSTMYPKKSYKIKILIFRKKMRLKCSISNITIIVIISKPYQYHLITSHLTCGKSRSLVRCLNCIKYDFPPRRLCK